jgi:hypothetical protein
MKKEQPVTQCPFLGEVVMDYCEAYPVRKPIPKHQINTPSPCTGESHAGCPAFIEIVARMQECAAGSKPAARGALNPRRR